MNFFDKLNSIFRELGEKPITEIPTVLTMRTNPLVRTDSRYCWRKGHTIRRSYPADAAHELQNNFVKPFAGKEEATANTLETIIAAYKAGEGTQRDVYFEMPKVHVHDSVNLVGSLYTLGVAQLV